MLILRLDNTSLGSIPRPSAKCRRAGIGRQQRLKIFGSKERVGSTPTGDTKIKWTMNYAMEHFPVLNTGGSESYRVRVLLLPPI